MVPRFLLGACAVYGNTGGRTLCSTVMLPTLFLSEHPFPHQLNGDRKVPPHKVVLWANEMMHAQRLEQCIIIPRNDLILYTDENTEATECPKILLRSTLLCAEAQTQTPMVSPQSTLLPTPPILRFHGTPREFTEDRHHCFLPYVLMFLLPGTQQHMSNFS